MLCFDVSITIWIGERPVQRSERVSRDLKLREFRVLLTVAQQGSMAKAATLLRISQPAVSKAIRDIEHVVGLRLLDRSRHGVEPTAYGRVLVKRGLAIFDELKQGLEELEFLADPAAGQLRIGSNETMAAGVLPAIIDMMSRQYPRSPCRLPRPFCRRRSIASCVSAKWIFGLAGYRIRSTRRT